MLQGSVSELEKSTLVNKRKYDIIGLGFRTTKTHEVCEQDL